VIWAHRRKSCRRRRSASIAGFARRETRRKDGTVVVEALTNHIANSRKPW